MDYNGSATCYNKKDSGMVGYRSTCVAFYDDFIKNLGGYAKYCNARNGKAGGCVPEYNSTARNGGFIEDYINGLDPVWVLKDGTIIIGYCNSFLYPIFAIDINGKSNPNKFGHDLFAFQFKEQENGIIKIVPFIGDNLTKMFPIANGGRDSGEMIKHVFKK